MAIIVNNPAPQQDSSGLGFIIGAIVFGCIVVLFLFYGLPALRNMGPVQVTVPAPEVNVQAPQINVEEPTPSTN